MSNLPENSSDLTQDRSLAQIVHSFMPYIQKRARGFTAAGLEPEDLVQEGLIGLFQAVESYDSGSQAVFSTYAITCINNRMASALRQAARKKHLPLNEYFPLDGDRAALLTDTETPEELAIANEAYAALRDQIQQALSVFEREVLSLHLEGYDYAVIAETLDTSVKAVDNALQRARSKLKPKR